MTTWYYFMCSMTAYDFLSCCISVCMICVMVCRRRRRAKPSTTTAVLSAFYHNRDYRYGQSCSKWSRFLPFELDRCAWLSDYHCISLACQSKLNTAGTLSGKPTLSRSLWYALTYKYLQDEVFHVRQAQTYWKHQWDVWDPKITTPPGLWISPCQGVRGHCS